MRLLYIALLFLASAAAHGQDRRGEYECRQGTVLYRGEALGGADAASFRDLGFGYAKDNNHVWMHGRILEYVDPASFRVSRRYGKPEGAPHGSGPGYMKTDFDVFFHGKKIDGASASTFRELADGYAADAFNVYFRGKQISGASPGTFEVLADGYAKDTFNMYYRGKKVKD